jgi:hypothetical protein
MKLLIAIFLVISLSSLVAQGFIFGHKNKSAAVNSTTKAPKSPCDKSPCKHKSTCKVDVKTNGTICVCTDDYHGQFCEYKTKTSVCDPNPCEHKGSCKVDLKNKKQSICNCTTGYFGSYCEKKTGCSANPCRKGNCTNNPKNLADFTCKCNEGFVGHKCDTVDACHKNPCKVGKCSMDEKFKAVCSCPPGWGSKSCDKRNCTITSFKGKHFSKDSNKAHVDSSILKKLEDLDGLAKLCHVKIHVLRSFKLGTPAAGDKSNVHYQIGHAIGFEIYDEHDKLLCNDICLGKIPIPQKQAKCFVDGLHAINWKWSILDPTTCHTGFATANTRAFNDLRDHHQVGCKENKSF